NAARMGDYFRKGLESIQSPFIEKIRGKGLLYAIVIHQRYPQAAWDLCMEMKENGLLAKPTHGNKIRFAPPLIINQNQLDECLEIIEDSLAILK
ncbi:MAG TPA: aminotransferase class III-fold pyridoxal phosphate-dependent enzyme, partial [Puia sp.]|nr:aminotransferase class III-fold pyridoxal phosphate-dependent enzyme [Puia sp.]